MYKTLFFRLLMFIYLALVMRSQKYTPLNCGVAVQCTSYIVFTQFNPLLISFLFSGFASHTNIYGRISVILVFTIAYFSLVFLLYLFRCFCLLLHVFFIKRLCHWFWLLAFVVRRVVKFKDECLHHFLNNNRAHLACIYIFRVVLIWYRTKSQF